MSDKREQEHERDKEREYRKMKPERVQCAETVINREQGRDQGTIRLIARERAESRCVAEEERNISQFPDGRVGFDRVRVVEVETVVKMVCIGREEGEEHESVFAERRGHAFTHHAILSKGTFKRNANAQTAAPR